MPAVDSFSLSAFNVQRCKINTSTSGLTSHMLLCHLAIIAHRAFGLQVPCSELTFTSTVDCVDLEVLFHLNMKKCLYGEDCKRAMYVTMSAKAYSQNECAWSLPQL